MQISHGFTHVDCLKSPLNAQECKAVVFLFYANNAKVIGVYVANYN